MAPRSSDWRSPLVGAAVVLVALGGLSALIAAAPPGSRIYEERNVSATVIAAIGVVLAILLIWLLRPGSWYLRRRAALDRELARLVGEPTEVFVGTALFDNLPLVPELALIRHGRFSLWQCAVGPNGVAIGLSGRHPRCVVIAAGDSHVSFVVGGPGGGPLNWRTELTPQLRIRIIRPHGELTITMDMLVSPSRARSVRDVGEVNELVAQLTAALSAGLSETPPATA